MLTLGNGVGGAALVNGRLLRGHCGMAGHLGHVTVEPHGAICSCGNRGCLETVFSAPFSNPVMASTPSSSPQMFGGETSCMTMGSIE